MSPGRGEKCRAARHPKLRLKLRFCRCTGQCANVFVLPGVPEYFCSKLKSVCKHFISGGGRCLRRSLKLALPEIEIVSSLNAAVAAHPAVTFGSYSISRGRVKTILTLEAAAEEQACRRSARLVT